MSTQNAIGEYPPNGTIDSRNIFYPYQPYQFQAPKVIKKIVTETMEYDEAGNLTKRTVVTEETTETPNQPVWTNETKPRIDVTFTASSDSVEKQIQNILNKFHNK